jgi:DNA-binding PadR family transcriptional regulator
MPWMARWFGQRPTRARRGDIRLGILALLCEEPRNGYQLMQELEARSEGSWRPSPGSVYPCLQQLEDEELVEVRSSTQGKVYQLTSKGKTWAGKHAEELKAPWKQDRGEEGPGDRHALMQSIRQIMSMLGHLSQTGTPKQLEEAQRALDQARKAIGRIAFLDDDAEAAAPEGPDDE